MHHDSRLKSSYELHTSAVGVVQVQFRGASEIGIDTTVSKVPLVQAFGDPAQSAIIFHTKDNAGKAIARFTPFSMRFPLRQSETQRFFCEAANKAWPLSHRGFMQKRSVETLRCLQIT